MTISEYWGLSKNRAVRLSTDAMMRCLESRAERAVGWDDEALIVARRIMKAGSVWKKGSEGATVFVVMRVSVLTIHRLASEVRQQAVKVNLGLTTL